MCVQNCWPLFYILKCYIVNLLNLFVEYLVQFFFFHHHLSPLYRIPPPPLPLPAQSPHCCPCLWVLSFFNFLKKFYCSITVVPIFPPFLSPAILTPSHTKSSPPSCCPCPWVLFTCSLTWTFLFSPLSPSSLLWSLSVCSLFPRLWFYFAHLFVLLIRFHLQVRSRGICLSPPGLFHLAWCSPDSSMLSGSVGVSSFFLLCSIPLCKCTTVFWPTHLLMVI